MNNVSSIVGNPACNRDTSITSCAAQLLSMRPARNNSVYERLPFFSLLAQTLAVRAMLRHDSATSLSGVFPAVVIASRLSFRQGGVRRMF